MSRRTIAERAAAGEILSVQDLTREEQGELLVWARDQGFTYREIIRRYGFTQTAEGLRTWHRNIVLDRPGRVPSFTDTDDDLLLRAVELYAGGSLDEPKSLVGIWFKVQKYIWANGGTTKAGPIRLRERWYELRGQPIPPNTPRSAKRKAAKGDQASTQAASTGSPAPPRATLALSFPLPTVPTSENQRSSSAQPSSHQAGANATTTSGSAGWGAHPDLTWGEYDRLSKDEMREFLDEDEIREVLGEDYSEQQEEEGDHEQGDVEEDGAEDDSWVPNPDLAWGEYDPLSENEEREVLGDDYPDQQEEEKDYDESDSSEDGAEDDFRRANFDLTWGEYDPLSENEEREALADGSSEKEEDDRAEDSDYDKGKEARGSRSRKG